jgi:hypothetical protein
VTRTVPAPPCPWFRCPIRWVPCRPTRGSWARHVTVIVEVRDGPGQRTGEHPPRLRVGTGVRPAGAGGGAGRRGRGW